jgi:hypothetical protein
MANKSKPIKLRAFRIENPYISESDSGILDMLSSVLTETSIVQDRRLKLNEQDEDEDILSDYSLQERLYVFGMMMRIIPAENGGEISGDLFSHNKINISELSNNSKDDVSSYKGHYYFALNNSFLVTNLSGTHNIDRFQTYINWLLRSVRKDRIYEFTPEMAIPEGLKLSEIKNIEFGSGSSSVIAKAGANDNIETKIKDITKAALTHLLSDVPELEEIQKRQLISAKLVLKMNGKPKDMRKEEYQKIMGAIVKPMSTTDGISVISKNGKKYNGDAIYRVKSVVVERTSQNRIVEEQLKQQMESFLGELKG